MQENRNTPFSLSGDSRGTVCINTNRVLDACRDRDCFENVRVYLTTTGQEILSNSNNIRTRCAKILSAFVGVEEVPFNNGFYQISVRYYIELEFESCMGVGRSQTFKGIAILEKEVILYGGEGRAFSFTSDRNGNFCDIDCKNRGTNDPVAVVQTVEPIVLSTKVSECGCPCPCTELVDIPDTIRNMCGSSDFVINTVGPRIYVSFGIFSVIIIQRPTQLLVQATDYSVPDKECSPRGNDDDPCSLFRTIAFPTSQFRGTEFRPENTQPQRGPGCGCGSKNNQ